MTGGCTCRVFASEMDIAAMGHMTGCPLRPLDPRELPEVSSGEKWVYKARYYDIIEVRPDMRIQFDGNWDTSVHYRLSFPNDAEEALMLFVRSKTEFARKFKLAESAPPAVPVARHSILAQVRSEAREEMRREINSMGDEYDMTPVIEYREAGWRHPALWWFIGAMSCLAFTEWVL